MANRKSTLDRLDPRIRDAVRFRTLNLLDDEGAHVAGFHLPAVRDRAKHPLGSAVSHA